MLYDCITTGASRASEGDTGHRSGNSTTSDATSSTSRTAARSSTASLARRGCDRHDVELLTSTYHDDGVDEHGATLNSGPEYAAWANAVHAPTSDNHLHNVTTHTVEIDGDVAHAESYVLVAMLTPDRSTATLLNGRYLDRLERRDGTWRIAVRRSTLEPAHGRRVDAAVQVLHGPGLPPRYTQPRRRLIPSTPDTRRPRRVLVTRHAPHELHQHARPAPKLPDGRRTSGREPAQIPRTDRQSTSAGGHAISALTRALPVGPEP